MNPASRRELLEGAYTAARLLELRIDPVRGAFDVSHLQEINRRIFQDLPGAGFSDVTPGQLRPAVATGDDWIKQRTLETVKVLANVAYSPMDTAAQTRLAELLHRAKSAELAKLKTADFTQAIGKLYAETDYIHAFPDGNSRTLREFTRELAKESGYELDWERFIRSPAGRDVLYIARDLSVNRLALPQLRYDGTKRDVLTSMDQLEGNRDLPDLLRDVVKPSRAVAFARLPDREALAAHPELAEAYQMVHLAKAYFEAKVPHNPGMKEAGMHKVAQDVQAWLNAGETTGFGRKRGTQVTGRVSSPRRDGPASERDR